MHMHKHIVNKRRIYTTHTGRYEACVQRRETVEFGRAHRARVGIERIRSGCVGVGGRERRQRLGVDTNRRQCSGCRGSRRRGSSSSSRRSSRRSRRSSLGLVVNQKQLKGSDNVPGRALALVVAAPQLVSSASGASGCRMRDVCGRDQQSPESGERKNVGWLRAVCLTSILKTWYNQIAETFVVCVQLFLRQSLCD
jgi:hypothetical protein